MLSINVLNKKPVENKKRMIGYFLAVTLIPLFFYLLFSLLSNSWNIVQALTAIINNDLIILTTILVCFVVVFSILYMPPKEVVLLIDSDNLVFGENTFPIRNLLAWTIIDLGEQYYELAIVTREIRSRFIYIYIPQQKVQEVAVELGQLLPYEESIVEADKLHDFFRNLGIK